MITVHMIGNAHLDPVWLWRWPSGLTEALLTCRTMADMLERYPELTFTRSDVWVYEQIEALDPELFARITRLVAEGRWEVVGGWYIQPDCNLPTAESFRRHMAIGRAHHDRHFGMHATVGYNVDSFGHAATLPSLLREYGYDSYVFMRPGPHEKPLPANLFRWRSPTDGQEVTAWRIHQRYNVDNVDTLADYLRNLVAHCAVPGVDHVACFYGVGDHGGGPTRRLVEWIQVNRSALTDCRLDFSTTRRFFDAVAPFRDKLPVVEDELQMHAVGCYSVVHQVKLDVRRAEHLAGMAERMVNRFPEAASADAERTVDTAWRAILFNQFHDTFDGSSVPDAYIDARDQLGAAAASLSDLFHQTLFRTLVGVPGDELQRIFVYNPSETAFDGCVAHEPWLDWSVFAGGLLDSDGRPVPYQVVQQSSLSGSKRMILWWASVAPGEFATYRLCHGCETSMVQADSVRGAASVGKALQAPAVAGPASVLPAGVANQHWAATAADGRFVLESIGLQHPLAPITLDVAFIDDDSDTWSHDIVGYGLTPRETAQFSRTEVEEAGPVRAVIRGDADIGRSSVSVRVSLEAASPVAGVDVIISWQERLTIAKLILGFPHSPAGRRDGIPGGRIRRPQNGYEFPVVDSTIVDAGAGCTCAVVGPDAFGIDGSESSVRYTLLRSPAYAWQGKNGSISASEHHRWTDRGEHRFRFFVQLEADDADCRAIAAAAHEPPVISDWTVGMKADRGDGTEVAPWTE